MHLAGDDEYPSDQEQDQVVDQPVIRQEKRAWIPHGGRRQRRTQDEDGLESTQGSRGEASQDNRDNRDEAGSSQDRHGKRKRVEGDEDGRRSKSGRMDQEADMDMEVER